jgi:uncharacterized protein
MIHDGASCADLRMASALLVIAKAPVPGKVKTRLSPPCTPEQAAELAGAALADTLAAAAEARAARRILVLDGEPGSWVPEGFAVLPQRGEGLAERLAAAFEDAGGPAFLVGMDTPQLTPALLNAGLAALDAGADAVFGASLDGGYWAIGLRRSDPAVFRGVPMSDSSTGLAQRARLAELELQTMILPPLLDVDTIDDARAVAAAAPETRFAGVLGQLEAAA